MGSNLLMNFGEAIAMILFGIGFANLLFQNWVNYYVYQAVLCE